MVFLIEVLDSVPDAGVEVGGVPERAVGKVVALEVSPGALDCVSTIPLYVGFLVRAGCDAALI